MAQYHGKHRLSDNRRTLGIVEWQPIGFCRRIGWYGRWNYDFGLCPTTHYHYDDDDCGRFTAESGSTTPENKE